MLGLLDKFKNITSKMNGCTKEILIFWMECVVCNLVIALAILRPIPLAREITHRIVKIDEKYCTIIFFLNFLQATSTYLINSNFQSASPSLPHVAVSFDLLMAQQLSFFEVPWVPTGLKGINLE